MFEQRQPSDIANYCISLDTKPDYIDYQEIATKHGTAEPSY